MKWNELCWTLLAFADDCCVAANSKDDLEKGMKAAYEYCNLWGLKINFEKTKCMVFTNSTVREELNLEIDGNRIQQVDSFTYLGVELFANGNWRRTQLKLAE